MGLEKHEFSINWLCSTLPVLSPLPIHSKKTSSHPAHKSANIPRARTHSALTLSTATCCGKNILWLFSAGFDVVFYSVVNMWCDVYSENWTSLFNKQGLYSQTSSFSLWTNKTQNYFFNHDRTIWGWDFVSALRDTSLYHSVTAKKTAWFLIVYAECILRETLGIIACPRRLNSA